MNKYGFIGAIAAATLATSAVAQSPAPTSPTETPPAVTTPAPTPPVATPPAATTPAPTSPTGAGNVLVRLEPNQMRATRLIGANVYNGQEKIGEINDLVLDNGGKVVGVVLGVGGFLGIGEKNVAVAYPSVTVTKDDRGNEKITVALTKDQLKDAAPYQAALKAN